MASAHFRWPSNLLFSYFALQVLWISKARGQETSNKQKTKTQGDCSLHLPRIVLCVKSELVAAKRVRTPAERIKTWMDTAQFRVSPDPEFDLAFPPVVRLHFENMDTPRLIGYTILLKSHSFLHRRRRFT